MSDLPKVEADVLTASDVARYAMRLTDDERKRAEFWQGLTPKRRKLVLGSIQLHLLRLLRNPEVWVPSSVEKVMDESNQFVIRIALPLEPSRLDSEAMDRRLKEVTVSAEEVIHELAATIRGMRDGDANDADLQMLHEGDPTS